MSLFLRIVFYGALAGTVTSTIYCAMVLVGAVRFARRKRREERAPVEFLPPVSVLKPLHGTEPDLEENLKRFFELDYPEYELLFCARQRERRGTADGAADCGGAIPQVRARFLTCGEPQFPNAKMWSMAMLAEAATYETLVTSDADARVTQRLSAAHACRSWRTRAASWRRVCTWGGRRADWRHNWMRWARAWRCRAGFLWPT